MAANLMRTVRMFCKGWLLLLSIIPAVAMAQTLVDPTRPPDEVGARPQGGGAEANELQSIIISPTRRAAIIHGQTVELGGKVGDVKLIEVSESGVVLQGTKGLEVLTLFPNVKINKKAIVPPMEDDAKNPAQKARLIKKPADRDGKKEEK